MKKLSLRTRTENVWFEEERSSYASVKENSCSSQLLQSTVIMLAQKILANSRFYIAELRWHNFRVEYIWIS